MGHFHVAMIASPATYQERQCPRWPGFIRAEAPTMPRRKRPALVYTHGPNISLVGSSLPWAVQTGIQVTVTQLAPDNFHCTKCPLVSEHSCKGGRSSADHSWPPCPRPGGSLKSPLLGAIISHPVMASERGWQWAQNPTGNAKLPHQSI